MALAALTLCLLAAPRGFGAPDNGLGQRPYLGWSSWSLEATKYPGYGGMGWLTAEHVKQQSDALHKTLQAHGYVYVNMDSGWADGFDATLATRRFQDDILYLGQPDDQGNPPPVDTVIVKPYQTASYTSTQDWKFNDSATGEVGVELLGPLTITRRVFQDYTSLGYPWTYSVSKSGYSNTLTLP